MSEINISVVYALRKLQNVVKMQTTENSTIKDVIVQSGLLQKHPEINISETSKNCNKVGIYNQLKKLNDVVKEGDRVEIYRKLLIDPKETRRKRAIQQKEEGII